MALNPIIDSRDARFVLFEMLEVDKLGEKFSEYADFDRETLESVLELAETLAVEKMYPVNVEGENEGCTYIPETKEVKIPPSYKAPLDAFYETGFIGMLDDPEIGGMGMPAVMAMSVNEMLCSANMALMMYPGLVHGAMHLIYTYGTEEQKDLYIPKMMSGEWGGTMALTEPDAGTDVGAMKTKAVKQDDGTYKITGQKIFITAAENDYYDNIIQPVLARIEGDPREQKEYQYL